VSSSPRRCRARREAAGNGFHELQKCLALARPRGPRLEDEFSRPEGEGKSFETLFDLPEERRNEDGIREPEMQAEVGPFISRMVPGAMDTSGSIRSYAVRHRPVQ
jgi:hypothetical protein